LPVDRHAPLDTQGFLDVSRAHAWWAEPGSEPRSVTSLANYPSSFVLLAAGGAGKSTALRWLREREPNAIKIDLCTLDKAGMHGELLDAIAIGAPIYLDALDEAALNERAVFRILEQRLTTEEARHVLWRLACRPAAWNPALAGALRAWLPGFEELKLLPLSRAATGEIAAAVGADPHPFLDALTRASLGRLAASPMRLRAAAGQWVRTGDLPEDQLSGIKFEVRQLLAETDRGRRQPSLPIDRRLRLAGRLAAIAVFSGVSRFAAAADGRPGLLGVAELPSTPEPEEPGTPVTPAAYEEVLSTALCDAAPDAAVSFAHQQYAEYLAASYLVERRIIRPQLTGLLSVHVDGLLPGPMLGVAAWLAGLDPALTETLIGPNALGFAQAGVELPSETRVVVVDGLLTKAAQGDIDRVWGLDLSAVTHPQLDSQLIRYLDGSPRHPELLWWIAKLAVAGNCRGLTSRLLDVALSENWPSEARRAAVAAVAALGGDSDLRQLEPLLHLDETSDPDDEILAAVIEALFPRLVSTPDLLQALRPQRNPNLVGGYRMLLTRLGDQLSLEDLPVALDWASTHVHGGEDAYEEFIPQLVRRGWAHADAADVLVALARLVAAIVGDPVGSVGAKRMELPWDGSEQGRQRELAVQVAGYLGSDRWFGLLYLRLITSDDAVWLLDQLPGLPPGSQEALARCVPALASNPTAYLAGLILEMPETHPAYAFTEGLRGAVRVDSDIAQLWRGAHPRVAQDGPDGAERHEAIYARLAAALDDAELVPDHWWRLASTLCEGGSGNTFDVTSCLFTHNLTERPGWLLLGNQQQARVLDLGVRYLSTHQFNPGAWAGHPNVPWREALSDWSGVYLMTTLVRHDPSRLYALDPPVWRKWTPAIVGAWTSGNENDQQLRCDLVDLMPASELPGVLDTALDQLDAAEEHNAQHLPCERLYDHLSPHLEPTLAERLIAGRYSGGLGATLLDLLIKNAPDLALVTCQQLVTGTSDLVPHGRRGLAMLAPSAIVDELAAGEGPPDDVGEILEHLALSGLDEAHLASLGRLLLRWFPPADASPAPSGAFGQDLQFEAGRIRGLVFERLAELGQTSYLEDISAESDPSSQGLISWYLRGARTRAADLAFTPIRPEKLLQLLSQADARLVRSSADLLEVTLNQLEQLQSELDKRASRYLWDFGRDESNPKSEDDISDWVRDQLKTRLGRASMIDREVQVSRRLQGIGTRIDLTATTPAATQPADTACVIAEAKLVTNGELMTAMRNQLVLRYLVPAGLQYGIYLVYWISPEQRATRRRTYTSKDRLLRSLNQQAAQVGQRIQIKPFLLDISHA